eukprot:CAMPEP_0184686626 /NCGR_PEP_ID=MMETSP0312-20130426/23317_1 /TAXON_ID=31354 /ORGANISM="Compsopogon coeruleus, Strain SAG 36.94" /LENGTH=388 /DNA_ID=CAMNT_0027141927 /DNA_START=935 /DNA_END=2101 /DNA_ORIENTATION=+
MTTTLRTKTTTTVVIGNNGVINARLAVGTGAWMRIRRSRRTSHTSQTHLDLFAEADMDGQGRPGQTAGIQLPSSMDDLVKAAGRSLVTELDQRPVEAGPSRWSISILIPGLNPQLENTAPFNEQLQFSIAAGIANVLTNETENLSVVLLFASAGTAASARKYLSIKSSAGNGGPGKFLISSLDSRGFERVLVETSASTDGLEKRAETSHERQVFIAVGPKNNRGDSVTLILEQIVAILQRQDSFSALVLLNPELEGRDDVLALNIREIQRRRAFVSSFQAAFYFRPLFVIQRPSLVAKERGLIFRPNPAADYAIYVFSSSRGQYSLVSTSSRLPSRETISRAFDALPPPPAQSEQSDERPFLSLVAFLSFIVAIVLFQLHRIGESLPR